MKAVLLFVLLAGFQAQAAGEGIIKNETIETFVSVSIHGLRCEVWPGKDENQNRRTYTRLEKTTMFGDKPNEIELEHSGFAQNGCRMKQLDNLSDQARMTFGFIHGARVIVKRVLRKLPDHEKCSFEETATLDLEGGVLLEDFNRELRDCK